MSEAAMAGPDATGPDATGDAPRRPIVLVHGAWHGGWCWKRVLPYLTAAGFDPYTPTLTGLGERAHLAHRDIDLELHIQDILGVLEMEDLRDVVLVGHSYGGMVITGVADRARDRIGSMIYLDAMLPEPGQAAVDFMKPERRAFIEESARDTGFTKPIPLSTFGVIRVADLQWAAPRNRPHPFRTMTQPITLARPAAEGFRRSYIYCAKPATGTFDGFAAKLRNDPTWRFHEFAAGHDAMITEPAKLAALLVDMA